MAAMTATETWDFLMEGTRTAHVATVLADGRPHVKPVWFELAGEPGDFQVVFTTAANTVAGRNLRRDGRVTLSMDDAAPPYAFVLIEGSAGLSGDPAELLAVATRLGGRYMGAERAAEYGAATGVPPELIVRVTRPGCWLCATSRLTGESARQRAPADGRRRERAGTGGQGGRGRTAAYFGLSGLLYG